PPEVGVTVSTRLSRRILNPSVVVANSLSPHVGADALWCWGRQRSVRTAAVGVCGCVALHAGVWSRVINSAHIAQKVSLFGPLSRGLGPWVLGTRRLVLRGSVVLCGEVFGGLICFCPPSRLSSYFVAFLRVCSLLSVSVIVCIVSRSLGGWGCVVYTCGSEVYTYASPVIVCAFGLVFCFNFCHRR
ncbi:unnamed protein product, partial [Sphacelaria rigidula]